MGAQPEIKNEIRRITGPLEVNKRLIYIKLTVHSPVSVGSVNMNARLDAAAQFSETDKNTEKQAGQA